MLQGCATHHEGGGERQEVTELSSSINTYFQNVVVATSDTFIIFHAVARYLSIFTHARLSYDYYACCSSGSPPHTLASV